MNTKNIYSPAYRQDYFEGYSNGLNPLLKMNSIINDNAFNSGFTSGRLDYERMNGAINEGIPNRIVTNKILEDFILAGLLGLSIDTEDYTSYQLSIIRKWYLCGVEMYDPNESIYLFAILEENGISLN